MAITLLSERRRSKFKSWRGNRPLYVVFFIMINGLTKGLVIKSPWIEMILHGEKTWEIRGNNTKIRGEIGLIKSGTGLILGKVRVINSLPMNLDDWIHFRYKHKVFTDHLPYPNTFAWVLEAPTIFKEPVPYKHPMGAVIWVNL